jgi:hypothetical protein
MKELILPITNAARNYGYITWTKKYDAEVHKILGEKIIIDLIVDTKKLTRKTIDWKRRRIGITYTITRNLPTKLNSYVISKTKSGEFRLSFI